MFVTALKLLTQKNIAKSQVKSKLMWANFKIDLRMQYQNCILDANNGIGCANNAKFKATDNKFNFRLRLDNAYQKSVQGLIIMVNGLILGSDYIPLGLIPSGPQSIHMQVARYGGSSMTTKSFEQIKLKVVSACENAMVGEQQLCIMNPTGMNATKTPDALGCNGPIEATTSFSVAWDEISANEGSGRRTTGSSGTVTSEGQLPHGATADKKGAARNIDLDEDLPENAPLTRGHLEAAVKDMMQQIKELNLNQAQQIKELNLNQAQQMSEMQRSQQLNLILSLATGSLVVLVVVLSAVMPRSPASETAGARRRKGASYVEHLPLITSTTSGGENYYT